MDLGVVDDGLESEVHVLLHVAMEQRRTRVVGYEVDFDGGIARQVDGVFDDAGRRFSGNADDLEAVAMQMDRMAVFHPVVKRQPIALAAMHPDWIDIGPELDR